MTVILLAAAVLIGAQTAQAQPPALVLEDLASQIVVLGPNDFIYGFREDRMLPAEMRQPVQRLGRLLTSASWSAGEVLPLLRHRNPKVRTLALVAVYYLDNPELLPEVVPLVPDAADTFPAVQPHASAYGFEYKPPLQAQTVGEIATAIVKIYMESGGYYYGPNGTRGQPGFDEYWKPRARRASMAGWWSVRLARAGHATIPTPEERASAIRLLRSRIDRLKEPDRTYVLMWLHGDAGSDVLVSTAELIELSRMLGPEHLLDVLRRQIRSDDPDLQPRSNNNYRYGRMCLFILQHARALLRPADADALLQQEMWERDFQKHGIIDPLISAWWAIAAAQLRGESASSILLPAWTRFQETHQGFDRLELIGAIWRQTGDANTAVDWFYQQLTHPNGQESYYLDKILKTADRSPVPFVKAMIQDKRFDELNWKSFEVLAAAMNIELGEVFFPMIDFYFTDIDRARADYPKETELLLRTLAGWRERLRQAP